MGSKKKPPPPKPKEAPKPQAPVERIELDSAAAEMEERAEQSRRRGMRRSIVAGETGSTSGFNSSVGQRRLLGAGL